MPIPNSILPSYSINPPAAPDPLAKYGEMLQLKNMLGQQQQIPLDLQEKQQQVQASQLDNQTKSLQNQAAQLQLKSQQAMVDAWTDPKFTSQAKGTVSTPGATPVPDAQNNGAAPGAASAVGFDPNAMVTNLVTRGVLPKDAISFTTSMADLGQKAATMTKDELANYKDSHDRLYDMLAPIVDMKGPDAATALANVKAKLQATPLPGLDPVDAQIVQQADLAHLPSMLGVMGFTGKLLDYHKEQAETAAAQTTAAKGALEVAPPTDAMMSTFTTKTLPSFTNISKSQRDAFTSEAQNARTIPEFNSVLARADATDKAEQMHQDSLAQTKALVGNRFADTGLTANEKVWTDPQHGYGQIASQAKFAMDALQAGADGNGLAASMGPVMTALGINSFEGTHRLAPAETSAAGLPGGYAEQFNAWADKAFKGKLSPQVAAEGQQLMTKATDLAYQRSLQASQLVAAGHALPPAQTPAMDRDGNVTTLDKVAGGGAQGSNAPAPALPTGNGKVIDRATAQAFYQAAGGDPAKARQLATQNGWKLK